MGLGGLIESLCVKLGEECPAQGKGRVAVSITVCLVPVLLFLPIAFLSAQVSLKVEFWRPGGHRWSLCCCARCVTLAELSGFHEPLPSHQSAAHGVG